MNRAARDVPLGASWAFTEHRTIAEIIADGIVRAAMVMTRPIEPASHLDSGSFFRRKLAESTPA
jgi:hypothetical protein